MGAIDIGPGATDRPSFLPFNKTYITLGNPANGSGTLDTFEIFAYGDTMEGCKIGTFSGSGTSYTMRDYESIGNVSYGSKQTFTGKSCDVVTGDYIGWSSTYGWIEASTSGAEGQYVNDNNCFDSSEHTYSFQTGYASSLYATGATGATASLPIFAYHYNNMRP